ncbi:MAG: sulfatase [Phycisphaerae bacterium]|nr:sulfatase [Phycisphaerae bacterium]
MNRHHLFSLIILACVALLAGSSMLEAAETTARPNILFILIDDMGWKDIGCAGSTYYDTPHIDRLASQGMRFLNAYSAAPVCTPSRGAIFSGKCPARTQLTTVFNGPAGPDDRLHDRSKYQGERDQTLEARHRHALPKKEVLVAKALADGGYTTGFFGKWHIGECPDYYPEDRGFHVAKGYRAKQNGARGHWMKDFYKDAVNLDGVDRDAYVADVLTAECVDFITEYKDGPWLAVLSHYLVHSPVQPKPDKLARYKNKPTTDQNNPGYAAMVESVDDSVGRVLQAISDLGLEQKTLVIFTSDNGGLTPKNTSNYPLMGGKSFPFEAGMKVPFIVNWPGKIRPGTSEQRIVGMDIYPTMLSAAGLSMRPAQHVDGLDLMPLLTQGAALQRRPIIFHYPHYTHATGPFSAIIADDWKLIRFYNDEQGGYLLYHLAVDPEEQNNVADTNAPMRDRLITQLDSALRDMNAEMPTKNPTFDPNSRSGRFNLGTTKALADKERALFKMRLNQ